MIINYSSLLIIQGDLFPNTLPTGYASGEPLEGTELSICRVLDLFTSQGYSALFMQELNNQLKAMDEDTYKDLYTGLFIKIRQRFTTKEFGLFDSHTINMLDIVNSILADNEDIREIVVSLRDNGRIAWIPGPNGINLEKGIGSCTGDLLEHVSIIGPFFSVSFLPTSLSLQPDDRFTITSQKLEAELKQAKN